MYDPFFLAYRRRQQVALIAPTNENLDAKATGPLTARLVHAARSRTTMTYRQARRQLESDCGFTAIFTPRMGRVAGVAMNAILEHVPDAPLLNVLLVNSSTALPGSGAVSFMATRYPSRRWLRKDDAHKDRRWRELIEDEAAQVYAYTRWKKVYRLVYDSPLPDVDDDLAGLDGKERYNPGRGGGEGKNHRALRLKVMREPSLVRRGLRPEDTDTEVELLSGDRVDVVSVPKDRTVAIEVKSEDSSWHDLRRGVYQCVKYRAVMAAQDLRRKPAIESWLVTEKELPGELRTLARRLGVRTKVIGRE